MIDEKKYVVIDVETTGLSSKVNDLISISFYNPENKDLYTKFLPLIKEKKVPEEITEINGISDKTLKGARHLSDDEFQILARRFGLYNKTVLHFGSIDPKFLKIYMLAREIHGFENIKFYNFKEMFITDKFSHGQYTKDNLCKALGIRGVTKIHSGANDCKLEWRLFEKLNGKMLFCPCEGFNRVNLYKITEKYKVPASYIYKYPHFKKYLNLPKLRVIYEVVYELKLSNKCLDKTSDFPQPIGFAAEHLINTMLGAKECKDYDYKIINHNNLNLVGSFKYDRFDEVIPVVKKTDGTLAALDKEYESYVRETNRRTNAIKKEIPPLINFIKQKIFNNKQIYTQELVVNEKYGVFGYCDFSNDDAMLEMKWSDNFYYDDKNINGVKNENKNHYKYQYLVTSNNRPSYFLACGHNEFKIFKLQFYLNDEIKKIKRNRSPNRKPYPHKKVYQYNIDGAYIKSWESVDKVSKELELCGDTIRMVCNGRSRTGGGYRWAYDYKKKLPPLVLTKRKGYTRKVKPILQYSLDGKFIKEWSCAKEAEKKIGVRADKISSCCTGKRISTGGFKWKHKL